jgi:hypothetical protein
MRPPPCGHAQCLTHARVRFQALARAIHRIETAVKQAEKVYKVSSKRSAL